ncbi:hypothetical protein Aperf_G00000043003 [Anoplocephala perfoliata]
MARFCGAATCTWFNRKSNAIGRAFVQLEDYKFTQTSMFKTEALIRIALLCVFLHTCSSEVSTNFEAHVYSYKSEINSSGNEHLQASVRGHALVNSRVISARRKPPGASGTVYRLLLHIVIDLDDSSTPLQGLILRDELGLVERIFLPASYNSSNIRINFLKAIAGIFNYHHLFVPGVEYDASGMCHAFYGEVMNSEEAKTLVIDKQKVACEPIGQPMDAGMWSASSILNGISATNSWIRYNFERDTGLLVKATTHERQSVAISVDNDASTETNIQVDGIQELVIVEEPNEEKMKLLQKLGNFVRTTKSTDLSTMVAELLGGPFTVQHLALSVPPQGASIGCGIQSTAFTTENLDSPQVGLNANALRELLNEFKKATEESARVSSAHAALQLIRFLRCLSANQASVQTLAASLEFIPASQRELSRQLETQWHNRLDDIVIDCGTELCLELLRQRILKVTQLADLDKVGSDASREVLPIRTYLINSLWPSVAHISNPSINILRELAAVCFHSLPSMEKIFQTNEGGSDNPYNCLLATSSLVPRFKGSYVEEKLLFAKYEETVRNYIAVGSAKFENNILNRHKLLAGIAAAEKLRTPSLSEPLISVVRNVHVPSVIRAVGLKALENLDLADDTSKINIVISKLIDLIDSPVPGPYFTNNEDEMILKFGAFSVLINLGLPAPMVADIISKFGSRKQWSLLTSCRRLIDSWCKQELLPDAACHCIKYGGHLLSESGELLKPLQRCSPGLGAGWSGLAGTNSVGEVNLIYGDIFDNRPYLLSDYLLQLFTGANGEIRASNFAISLLDSEGEAKLMSLNIYANQMEVLMGKGDSQATPWLSIGFSIFNASVPPTQIFSGGLTEIVNLLFMVPNQPTPFYTATRLPLDVRRYLSSSSGWVLKNDLLGVASIEFSGALSSSLFSQSGTALIRTRAALAVENSLTLLSPESRNHPVISAVNGAGTAVRFDFLTYMEIGGMPETICMHFQRSRITPIMRWVGNFKDSSTLGKRTSILQPLPKTFEEVNDFYKLTQYLRVPPVSFSLGSVNAARCRKVGITNEWD